MLLSYELSDGKLGAPEHFLGLAQSLAARESNVGEHPRIIGDFTQGPAFGASTRPSAKDL